MPSDAPCPPLSDAARSALEGLRIGCVRYLNARPLIAPYPGPVVLDHPSTLAASLVAGELDVALVPVFEALRTPRFRLVDGVAIAANGPVWSVFVAWTGGAIRDVVLDPASLTSANLCRVLFPQARFHESGAPVPRDAARLLIGNQAIDFRREHGEAYYYLDLAGEWKERTGLPFVFALWLMRPDLPDLERIAAAFREMAQTGRAAIPRIAAGETDPAFARRYLGQHLLYDLGEPEKAGLALYRKRLIELGRLPASEAPFHWV